MRYDIPVKKHQAFGAVAYLLAEAVNGEYSAEVEDGTVKYTVKIPVWLKLSGQSARSLEKLVQYADAHEVLEDSIYATHVFTVPLDE